MNIEISEDLILKGFEVIKKSICEDKSIPQKDREFLVLFLDPMHLIYCFGLSQNYHLLKKLEDNIVQTNEYLYRFYFNKYLTKMDLEKYKISIRRFALFIKEDILKHSAYVNKHIELIDSKYDFIYLLYKDLISTSYPMIGDMKIYEQYMGKYFNSFFKYRNNYGENKGFGKKLRFLTRYNEYIYEEKSAIINFINTHNENIFMNKSFYENFNILKNNFEIFLNHFEKTYINFLNNAGYPYVDKEVRKMKQQLLGFCSFNKIESKVLRDKKYLTLNQKEEILNKIEEYNVEKERLVKNIGLYIVDEQNIEIKKDSITTIIDFSLRKTPVMNKVIKNFIKKDEDYEISFSKLNNTSIALKIKDLSEENFIIKNEEYIEKALILSLKDFYNILISENMKKQYKLLNEDDFKILMKKQEDILLDQIKNNIRALKIQNNLKDDNKIIVLKKKI